MKNVNFFKPLALTIGLILSVTFVNGAARTASVTGNWSNTATWGGSAAPTSIDDITINSGITVTVDVAVAQCASVTFAAVSVSSALTISGTNSLAITGLLSMPRPGSGTTCTVNVAAGSVLCGSLTMAATSVTRNDIINISTGSFTVSGTYTANANASVPAAQFIFSSTGSLTFGGTITLNAGLTTPPTITTVTGSTVIYSGAAQTGIAATYANLTLSGSAAKTFATTPTVNGVLSMEGTASVIVTGTGVVTYGAAATLQYNKPAVYTATAEEWITPFAATGGVIIANAGTITLNTAKVFGANTNVPLTINSWAILATANFGLTFHGDFINNGTLTAGSSPIIITGTTATHNIGGFTTTGLLSMTKASGTATLTGDVNGAGLTINGAAGTLNLGTTALNHTFSGIWTRTAGTLNGGSSTINFSATGVVVSGTGGTFTPNTGTVNYTRAGTQTVGALTYNNLTLSGSSAKTTTSVTVNGILSMEGTATASVVPTYGSAATLQYKGSAAQTTGLEFPASFTTGQLAGIKIENTNGVTLNAAKNIGARSLTIGSVVTSSIFSDGGFQLTATGTLNLTSGTFKLGAGAATTFPGFGTRNIAAGTTVEYAATATQTIKGITYSNLNISGTGTNSKIADADITVDGILNLASANASTTQGCLSMSTFTLNMGADATTTGTGDVTGIVKRTQTFADNTQYSFGNQYTLITFIGTGTKPGSLSCQITLGTAPWTGTILRQYTFAKDVDATDKVIANLHFLTGELNSNTASTLVFWDNNGSGGTPEEHGKSNNDLTNNWVGLSGLGVTYLAPTSSLGVKTWSLDNATTANLNSWNGIDNVWTNVLNWTLGHTPLTTEDVQIPSGKSFYPTLPNAVEIKSLEIQSGASLTSSTYTLTINGYTGAWINNGTFTGTGGTVVFSHGTISHVVSMSGSGTNTFNNLTVNTNTYLQPASGFYLKIAGTVSNGYIIDLKATNNTFEYNGSGQSILNLQGPSADIGYSNLVINSSGTATLPVTLNVMRDFTLSGGTVAATAASTIDILGNVTLTSGTFTGSSSVISVGGNWTNNGATFTPGTSTVTFNSTAASQAINGTAASQTFNAITVAKTAQTLSIGGSTTALTITGGLTITSGTLGAGTAANINVAGNWSNSGTFTAGSGTVTFNGSSAQSLGGTNTFYNLTINNTGGGVTASANQTVNSELYLQGANASATQGCLKLTDPYQLIMGATATTTGTGDVTGIVTRNSFLINTPYTFGNQYTTIDFYAGGTLPASLSVKIVLSTNYSWITANKIYRYYDIQQTGGSALTMLTLNLHYLDGELNGATEGDLALFDHDVSSSLTEDKGSSNFNSTLNWVGLANLSLTYVARSSFDAEYWTIGTSVAGNDKIWTGEANTDWNNSGNWISGIPTETSHVHIPVTTNHPTLPASTTIGIIQIETGGVLNGGTGTTLTIAGSSSAWHNLGTFNPGTSTVIFTNAAATMADPTDFYNVTVADGASLILGTDNIMRIAGTLSLSTTGILNAASNHNTVEYNGSSQTVVYPNGSTPGYHDLVLSGSGTKTMPASALSVAHNFSISGTASVTAAGDITIGGNWSNNGTFTPGAYTVTFNGSTAQTITGANTFNNLTINSGGVTANASQSVNGTLYLQSANASDVKGSLDITDPYKLTLGASAITTGIGDVTGIVRRVHTFVAGTSYTYNHQFTTLTFAAGGTPPSFMEVKVKIGTAPSWKPGAIQRVDDWIRANDGSGYSMTAASHYLDSELNGNDEDRMVRFKYVNPTVSEVGRSSNSIDDNWISNSNITSDKITTSYGWERTYANPTSQSLVWNGVTSEDFTVQTNWTPNSTPVAASNIIIPDASLTPNDPLLTAITSINSLSIENGGILNNTGNYNLTIAGTTGAWLNAGTFNAGTGTVFFTGSGADYGGTTDFKNITISSGSLVNQAGSIMRIGGSITQTGTWNADMNDNTVEFNGSGQTVPVPTGGTGCYHNLLLSGSGTTYFPATLCIKGNFTQNATLNTITNGNTLTLSGTTSQILGSNAAGISLTKLIVNNTSGVVLNNINLTIGSTLALTNGAITTGNSKVIITPTYTTNTPVSRTNGWVNGNLQKSITTRQVNILFETGSDVYAPATLNLVGGSGAALLIAKVTKGNPTGGSGINQAAKCDHYWSVSKTSGTFNTYNLLLELANTINAGTITNYGSRKYLSSWENVYGTHIASSTIILTSGLSGTTGFGDFEVGEAISLEVATQPINMEVCSGGNTSFTAVSNSEPTPTVRWQREDGNGFVDIDGALDGGIYTNFTSTTLDITGATGDVNNYQYLAIFTNINSEVQSDPGTLTVTPVSVGGTLTGGGTVCSGTNSTMLTLGTGSYTGTITKWQYSTDGGTVWSDISNSSETYSATNLSTTTKYRVEVQSGACSIANSDEQTVEVSANIWQGGASGDWEVDGNWCGGIPLADANITIPASTNVHITSSPSSSVVCNDLTITSGGILTIDAGKSLTVNGTLTNNAAATGIVIKSDATSTGSLINSTAAVPATVERYMNDSDWTSLMDGWHFLSSPVAAQSIDPNFTGTNYDFYSWYEPGNVWVNYKNTTTAPTWNTANGGSTDFIAGKGYMAAYEIADTKVFSGALNVSDVAVSGLGISGTGHDYYSWHLLGNPFPSALEWDATESWNLVNIAGVAKIWNEANQSYSDLTSDPPTYIPSTNGFMVMASSGTGSLTIPEIKRVHNAQAFYKSTVSAENLKFVVRNIDAGNAQECNVVFNTDATPAFDLMYDGEFLAGYGPSFYAVAGERKFSTNALPELTSDLQVPFGFVPNTGNQYRLEVLGAGSIPFTAFLLDKKTNTDHNLSLEPDYTFSSSAGDLPDRFLLHFAPVGIVTPEATSDFSVFAEDGIINIISLQKHEGRASVTDLAGRSVAVSNLVAGEPLRINMQGHTGVYLVSIITTGGVSNTKIFVK